MRLVKCRCFLLISTILLLICVLLPMYVLADESKAEEKDAFASIQEQMDDILDCYLGSKDLSEDEIVDHVVNMSWDKMQAAITDIEALETTIALLSEDEIERLEEEYGGTQSLVCFYEVLQESMMPSLFAASGTHAPVEGVTVKVSGATDNSMSGGAITVTAKGSGGILGFGASAKTATISIEYVSEGKSSISFDWTATSVNQLKIDGAIITGSSGKFSKVIEGTGSITVLVTTEKNSTTNKLVMSNFALDQVADTSKIKFSYDNKLGSITVNENAVQSGETVSISVSGNSLVATPSGGNNFVGWIDENNEILSFDSSFIFQPSRDMTVQAVFADDSTAWFLASNIFLSNDFQVALDYAEDNSNKLVVLLKSGELPENKKYCIPSGVNFLIPNSKTDTGAFTGKPDIQITGTITDYPAKAFRTLIVPSNTTITCYGKMNVNGHRSDNGQPFNGHIIGDYGKLILGSENKTFNDPLEEDLIPQLIIGSGGTLYCYGYITGSGMVNVQSQGTLHETFQMADWPGGNNGITWSGDNYKNLFLCTQYYIQNIEAPLKIDYGATQYIEAVITISVVGEKKFSAPFISPSSGMFIIGDNGYILRIYDYENDRMHYHFNEGSCTIGIMSMKESIYSITTENSIMPLTNSISVHIEDGAVVNLNKPMALLPGAEVIIDTGGIVNLGNSALYIFDVNDWSAVKDNGDGTYSMRMFFNRTAEALNGKWSSISGVDINKDPKSNPLPYVATLNSISPSATGYYRNPSNKNAPLTNSVEITASGSLEINGTLNIAAGGYIYTSSGGNSENKAIKGEGTINHNGGLTSSEINIVVGASDYKVNVKFNNAVGNLAGIGELQPFTNGGAIYHGLGEEYGNYWYQTKTVTAPACTDGYTTYNCSGGTGLIVIDKGTALGHKWNDGVVVKEPSLDEKGTVEYTCTVCTETKEEELPQLDPVAQIGEEGYVTLTDALAAATSSDTIKLLRMPADNPEIDKNVMIDLNGTGYTLTCKKGWTSVAVNGDIHTIGFKVYGTSVRVGDNLDLYFYVQADQLESGKVYVAKITQKDNIKTIPSFKWESYSNGNYLRFCYNDIAAKEMTDDVTVEIFYADAEGNATTQRASYTCAESVAKYAKRTLQNEVAKNNDELITVLVDMLNYGASCQTYFTYKDDASQLANVGIESYQKDYAGKYGKAWTAISNDVDLGYSANVTAESKLVFSFYFATSAIQATDATVTYRDHYGNDVVKTITPIVEDGQYRIKVEGLAVADGRQQITCTVKTINDKEVSITSSIESYVATIENDNSKWDVVFRDLMYFVDSAYEYFH